MSEKSIEQLQQLMKDKEFTLQEMAKKIAKMNEELTHVKFLKFLN